MQGYPTHLVHRLVHGFRFGFKLGSLSFSSTQSHKNLQSAQQFPHIIADKINKEVQLGRFSGPYEHSPFQDFTISPLGLREKKTPGEYRVIHNLSYPYDDTSVNASIPRDKASVKYGSIVDAIKHINYFGQNCFLAKTDIKSAFRIIPIHPDDRHLLGFKWDGKYYFDNCLPMGCSSSCQLFELFSTALHWIMEVSMPHVGIVHVLDDFLFVTPDYDSCLLTLNTFLDICRDIGVPIADEKTVGPDQCLPFVGIQLDTHEMQASLPQDKVDKFLGLIDLFMTKKSITLTQLQSLCGMLNFACGVIAPARAFSRRLYDLGIGISKPYYKIKLSQEVKKDLEMWRLFLLQYNRRTFLLDYIFLSNQHLKLYTDAASTIGFGGIFGDLWFGGLWSQQCLRLNIALLELYPICLALHLWGHLLRDKCIHIFTDNMAIVHVLSSCTSKNKSIMILVRKFVLVCMKFNILVRVSHYPGALNQISDAISRNQVHIARGLQPSLAADPAWIPLHWTLDKWLEQ